MGHQLPIDFGFRPDLERAARDVFDTWGHLKAWAICRPGCVWCAPGAPDRDHRRHLAAKALAAALEAREE